MTAESHEKVVAAWWQEGFWGVFWLQWWWAPNQYQVPAAGEKYFLQSPHTFRGRFIAGVKNYLLSFSHEVAMWPFFPLTKTTTALWHLYLDNDTAYYNGNYTNQHRKIDRLSFSLTGQRTTIYRGLGILAPGKEYVACGILWAAWSNSPIVMPCGTKISPEMQCVILQLLKLLKNDQITLCVGLSEQAIRCVIAHFWEHGTVKESEPLQDGPKRNWHLQDVDVEVGISSCYIQSWSLIARF